MVYTSKVVLAIGAHSYDIESGCGGTLCQAAKNGAKIMVQLFSSLF